jgi:hypothetical protein
MYPIQRSTLFIRAIAGCRKSSFLAVEVKVRFQHPA